MLEFDEAFYLCNPRVKHGLQSKEAREEKGQRVATTAATAKKQKQLTPKPPATPRPDPAATTNHGSTKPQEGQPKPAQAGESVGAAASVAPSQSSHHRGYFHALVGDGRDSDNNSSASHGAKAGKIQTLDTDPPPDDDDDDDDDVDDDLAHDILHNRADAASQQSAALLASGGPLEAVLVSAVSKAVEAEKAPPAWVLSMLIPGAAHQQDIQKLQSTADDNKNRITAIENYISGQEAFLSSGGAYGAQRGGRAQRGTDKRDKDFSKSRGPPVRAKAKVSFADTAKPDTAKHRKECDFIGCRFGNVRFTHTRAECKNEETAKNEGYTVTKN
ncbi:unnamed protein product [Ectocarpus sp. CCAP 1310/34]|nr:unnamed protein product [Ectocarpus sp. CCAP 1310/34]